MKSNVCFSVSKFYHSYYQMCHLYSPIMVEIIHDQKNVLFNMWTYNVIPLTILSLLLFLALSLSICLSVESNARCIIENMKCLRVRSQPQEQFKEDNPRTFCLQVYFSWWASLVTDPEAQLIVTLKRGLGILLLNNSESIRTPLHTNRPRHTVGVSQQERLF